MATLEDVARRAGVAASTVSRVLNGTRFVTLKTRLAVMSAVADLGYTPNVLARSLANSRTNVIGLVMSSTRNRFFADIITAIERECDRAGLMVLLANTDDRPEREIEVIKALHQRRVDGVIIAPTCAPDADGIGYLLDKRIPAVMVDRLPGNVLDGVGVENCHSIRRLVRHLAGLGHRRIGFMAGQAQFTTSLERRQGFIEGMAEADLPVEDGWISIGNVELDGAKRQAAQILREHAVTAFIGGNNLSTIGIMLAAEEAELSVPGNLAVAGFDDFDWAEAFHPRLTVMAQPCLEIGRLAAALLQRRISQPDAPREIVQLTPQLIIRGSCGHARVRHKP